MTNIISYENVIILSIIALLVIILYDNNFNNNNIEKFGFGDLNPVKHIKKIPGVSTVTNAVGGVVNKVPGGSVITGAAGSVSSAADMADPTKLLSIITDLSSQVTKLSSTVTNLPNLMKPVITEVVTPMMKNVVTEIKPVIGQVVQPMLKNVVNEIPKVIKPVIGEVVQPMLKNVVTEIPKIIKPLLPTLLDAIKTTAWETLNALNIPTLVQDGIDKYLKDYINYAIIIFSVVALLYIVNNVAAFKIVFFS